MNRMPHVDALSIFSGASQPAFIHAHDLIGMSIAALARPDTCSPTVDITIPVYNEERDLAPAVRRLHNYLNSNFPFAAQITIADNASTDGTAAQALRLATELRGVRLIRLNEKGRGRGV